MRYVLACLAAAAAWIAVEVGGGLMFLAAGVRLWRYETLPLWNGITSPAVWIFAVTLIVPLSLAFDRAIARHVSPPRAFWAHLGFVMAIGPVLELVINEYLFKAALGHPLFEYVVLPTFGGSGSLLSPLYYATLLVHLPVTGRLLGLGSHRAPSRAPAQAQATSPRSTTRSRESR